MHRNGQHRLWYVLASDEAAHQVRITNVWAGASKWVREWKGNENSNAYINARPRWSTLVYYIIVSTICTASFTFTAACTATDCIDSNVCMHDSCRTCTSTLGQKQTRASFACVFLVVWIRWPASHALLHAQQLSESTCAIWTHHMQQHFRSDTWIVECTTGLELSCNT